MSSRMMFCSPPKMMEKHKEGKTKLTQKDDIRLLQAEAEKIRNWHVQAEMTTKQLEKSVQNLTQTVESQRKSLVEVQMENESLSTKMQEEINKRVACLQKVDATREMCNLLKTQACELEGTLNYCQDLKSEIEFDNADRKLVFQKLASDFNAMSDAFKKEKETHNETVEAFKKQLNDEHAKHVEIASSQTRKISDCLQLVSQNDITIEVLTHSLSDTNNNLTELEKNYNLLSNKEKELNLLNRKLSLELSLLRSVKNDLTLSLKETSGKLTQTTEKLKISQRLNTYLEDNLNEKCFQIQHLEEKYEYDTDALQTQSEQQLGRMEILNKEINNKSKLLEENQIKIDHLEKTCYDASTKISLLEDYKNELNEKYNQLVNTKADDFTKLQQYQNTIDQLMFELSELKLIKASMEEKFSESRSGNAILKERNESLQKELTELRSNETDLHIKTTDLVEKLENLEKDLGTLNEEQKKSLHALTEKENFISTYQGELKLKTLTLEDQTKALNLSAQLYNELQAIRNSQALELCELNKQIKVINDEKLSQMKLHQNEKQDLEEKHAAEITKMQDEIKKAQDKLQNEISKNQLHSQCNKVLITPGNTSLCKPLSFSKSRKISKPRRSFYEPIANEVSFSGADESWCKSPIQASGGKYTKPKRFTLKHSTPIQRVLKPGSLMRNTKSASAKKCSVKNSLARRPAKKSVKENKSANEYNWFDVDKVYGFFE
ncbi:uncharacterized protein LOC143450322 [Clavelina lepadiformis]|uniref:uncharacterized protein LOC143450322 n=1 Tax=Clavelina lepadiformis TaxID=159417 RepID=UPI00404108DF